jgi:hypothetical protein
VKRICGDILGLSPPSPPSKQYIGDFPKYGIIPSNPLKYIRSKKKKAKINLGITRLSNGTQSLKPSKYE